MSNRTQCMITILSSSVKMLRLWSCYSNSSFKGIFMLKLLVIHNLT